MLKLKIAPVERPEDFATVKFSAADHAQAVKKGEIEVYAGTAIEAVRNSKGMYKIVEERPKVEVEIKGAKDPEEMTSVELVAEMTAYGKAPRKRISREKAVEFVRDLRIKAAELIYDESEEAEG